MPDKTIVEEFKLFREKCAELYNLVNCFKSLYENPNSESLLQEISILFFQDLHGWMIDLYFVYASRLIDPAAQGSFQNLTVEHIKNACDNVGVSTPLILALEKQLAGYRSLVQNARHKVIAHLDLESASSMAPFGEHSEAEFSQFLCDLQSFCDEVGVAIGEGPLDFSAQPGGGDVLDLLAALRLSKVTKTEKAQNDR